MIYLLAAFLVASNLFNFSCAQYFPPTPEGITVLKSRFRENVTISYKEVSFVLQPWYVIAEFVLDLHLRDHSGRSFL